MQDNYAPKLRTVGPTTPHLTKAAISPIDGPKMQVGALDEIAKRISSANGRLYDLMLRARAIADAAFGATGPANPPGDEMPRPAPACKVSVLDEAASVTHRILSELEIELERLAQL